MYPAGRGRGGGHLDARLPAVRNRPGVALVAPALRRRRCTPTRTPRWPGGHIPVLERVLVAGAAGDLHRADPAAKRLPPEAPQFLHGRRDRVRDAAGGHHPVDVRRDGRDARSLRQLQRALGRPGGLRRALRRRTGSAEVGHWAGREARAGRASSCRSRCAPTAASYQGALTCVEPPADFHGFEIIDGPGARRRSRPGGLVITGTIADKLGVGVG